MKVGKRLQQATVWNCARSGSHTPHTASLQSAAEQPQHFFEDERAHSGIRRMLDVLATESRMDRALGHVFAALCEELQTHSGAIWLRQADGLERFRIQMIYHRGDIIDPASMHHGAQLWPIEQDLRWRKHIDDRRPAVYLVDHLPGDADDAAAFFRRINVRCLLGVPLLLAGKVIGCLTFRFTDERCFDDEQLDAVQALAHHVTLALRLNQLSDIARAEAKQAAMLAERNRLGQEIHDGLAQSFTGILVQLEALEPQGDMLTPKRIADTLTTVRDLARAGLADVRHSVSALRPRDTQGVGFVAALAQLAERSTVPGRLACYVDPDGFDLPLMPEVQHELFRVVQEAVSNALRHARARNIHIDSTQDDQSWSLHIEDDGVGMRESPEQSGAQGFGLESMRKRAQALGGSLEIVTGPMRGTRVSVHLPMPHKPADRRH